MSENINKNEEIRYCKKCGVELPGTDKHKLCINCRKKRGGLIRNIVIGVGSIGSLILFAGGKANSNREEISGDDRNEKRDDSERDEN